MNARLAVYGIVAMLLVISWMGACVIYQAAEMGDNIAPLDPRQFESWTVVAVGTGGGYENPDRGGPSLALGLGEEVWLVDAGRGVAEGLRAAAIPVDQPTTVFLTSLAPQNCVGLDDLLFTGWLAPREHSIRLIGPVGTAALADGLMSAYSSAIAGGELALALPPAGVRLEVVEVGETQVFEEGAVRVTAQPLSGGPLPALAWRFEHEAGSVVISSVGWADDVLVEFARDADWWIHEAVYIPSPEEAESAGVTVDVERLEREAAVHTSIVEVGELAKRAGVGGLGLIRLRPPPMISLQVTGIVSDQFDGTIWIPEDGDELDPSS